MRERRVREPAVKSNVTRKQEPWLAGLVGAHLLLLAAVVALRSNQPFQLMFLIASFTVVRCGEAINKELAGRWRSFAARDYFDPGGAFYSAIVAAPLLAIVCVQLSLQLTSAWRLMVGLKAAQIRRGRRAAAGGGAARPRTRSESRAKKGE